MQCLKNGHGWLMYRVGDNEKLLLDCSLSISSSAQVLGMLMAPPPTRSCGCGSQALGGMTGGTCGQGGAASVEPRIAVTLYC